MERSELRTTVSFSLSIDPEQKSLFRWPSNVRRVSIFTHDGYVSVAPVRGSRDEGIVRGPDEINLKLLSHTHNHSKFAGNALAKS